MKNLADITELIEHTTSMLMGSGGPATAESSIALIDQWIPLLSESETTADIAVQLQSLKNSIQSDPKAHAGIPAQMTAIAKNVLLLAPEIGAEGEMPSLLAALATALRSASDAANEA